MIFTSDLTYDKTNWIRKDVGRRKGQALKLPLYTMKVEVPIVIRVIFPAICDATVIQALPEKLQNARRML